MPRKSIALFLATTGLISTLAGCSPERDAGAGGERGEEMKGAPSGQPAGANGGNSRIQGDNREDDSKEGGEGGEGGEG